MKKQVKSLKLTKEELNLLDGILDCRIWQIVDKIHDEEEARKKAIANQKACPTYSGEYNAYDRVIETHEFFIDKYTEEQDLLIKIRTAVCTAMYL